MGASKLVLHSVSYFTKTRPALTGALQASYWQLSGGKSGHNLQAYSRSSSRAGQLELAPGRELVPASVAGSASCAWPKAFDEAHIAQHASPSMSSTISPRFYSHGPTVFIVLQASMQARDGWAKGCLSIDSGQT